jgi:hypothetical protein
MRLRGLRIKFPKRNPLAIKPLRVESIDRVKDDIFVLFFSDETSAMLTAQELAEYFADTHGQDGGGSIPWTRPIGPSTSAMWDSFCAPGMS